MIVDHLDLIRSRAWAVSRRTGWEIDDLLSQAYLIATEAMRSYNAERGKVSTYLWHRVEHGLLHYVSRERKRTHVEDVPELPYEAPVEQFLTVASLSREARVLLDCGMVVGASSRGTLERIGRSLKWSWKQTWAAVKELERAYKEVIA